MIIRCLIHFSRCFFHFFALNLYFYSLFSIDSITDSEFDGLDDSTPELDGEMPARAGPSSMVTPIQPTRARRNAPKAAEAHQTESEDEDRETEDSPVKTRVVASSKAKATQLPKSTKARKPMESKETNKAGTSSASSNAQMTHLNGKKLLNQPSEMV